MSDARPLRRGDVDARTTLCARDDVAPGAISSAPDASRIIRLYDVTRSLGGAINWYTLAEQRLATYRRKRPTSPDIKVSRPS